MIAICYECGGNVTPIACVGRTGSHRGETGYLIPADLPIPTCEKCGSEWEDNELVERLNDEFEKQHREKIR